MTKCSARIAGLNLKNMLLNDKGHRLLKLRKLQKETQDIINKITAGSSIKTIIAEATPGAGKSMIPLIAGKLIVEKLADAICWVVPRKTLQRQGEQNFQDVRFRELLGYDLVIRANTNNIDPCRQLDGFITTYQAVGVDDKQTVLNDFLAKRYILILDENHHVEVESYWYVSLKPLVDRAKYLIIMTGTMERGDGDKIAFMPYDTVGTRAYPKLQSDASTSIIRYTRKDALAEKAILPLSFHLSEGHAQWIDKDGAERESGISQATKDITSQALFTAISTEFAETLLEAGIRHWHDLKRLNRNAKLLVVTANYEEAKRISEILKTKWVQHEIATSHESVEGHRAINRLKSGVINVLVTIAMAYEGLDVPEITHIICLTNIRSTPWIEQMVARAVRVDPHAGPYESQSGYIFAPDDIMFREIVSKIEREQRPFVRMRKKTQISLFSGDGEGEGVPNIQIQPLSSVMSGHREVFLGERPPMPYTPQTPSEIETVLRHRIEQHVRLYSYNNRHHNGQINAKVKAHFGKARAEMTGDELDKTLAWVQKAYPIEIMGRGYGRTRVPTKPAIWREK